jgi:hypothetical protein
MIDVPTPATPATAVATLGRDQAVAAGSRTNWIQFQFM